MKSGKMSIKKLRVLVEKCLSEGISLAFYDPDPETENQEPLSEAIKEAVMMGYATALHDVLEAIDGKPSALEDAASDQGRLAIRPEDLSYFQKAMQEDKDKSQ